MDVRDKLGNMVISSSTSSGLKKIRIKDSDVKRQVQRLIKKWGLWPSQLAATSRSPFLTTHSLITNTQALDELPRRRYLNLRVFFTDDCPPEYQPPLFR